MLSAPFARRMTMNKTDHDEVRSHEAARRQRLKLALRENLKRRKLQTRRRGTGALTEDKNAADGEETRDLAHPGQPGHNKSGR